MKKRSGEKIKLLSVDELLGVPSGDPVTEIDVDKIYPFENLRLRSLRMKRWRI